MSNEKIIAILWYNQEKIQILKSMFTLDSTMNKFKEFKERIKEIDKIILILINWKNED